MAGLVRRAKAGANNFYWIGGLSVVNSLITAFGGGVTFVIGLAITQIVDGIAIGAGKALPDAALIVKIIGLAISVGISGVIALFGYFAGNGKRWAFITGMILYGFDALVMLLVQDWIAFAFHLYFLYGLYNGLQALNQLQKSLPSTQPDFPKSMGI